MLFNPGQLRAFNYSIQAVDLGDQLAKSSFQFVSKIVVCPRWGPLAKANIDSENLLDVLILLL